MIRKFKNIEEYNTFTHNGKDMVSGDLYWVEDNKSAFFLTNNIDGYVKKYDMMGEIPEEYIVPSGNIAITENGDVDVTQYATASVNVPIPEGYIQPSGNIAITENGEGIDVTNYATATVNVPSTGGGNEDLFNLIERDIEYFDIPQGTTKIGDYAFYHSSMADITIPDSVTSIGEYAFAYSKLTTVTIPSSVKYIDTCAFDECIPLTTITLLSTTPPRILRSALGSPGVLIFVPAESVDAYKTANNWSNYANYISAITG